MMVQVKLPDPLEIEAEVIFTCAIFYVYPTNREHKGNLQLFSRLKSIRMHVEQRRSLDKLEDVKKGSSF